MSKVLFLSIFRKERPNTWVSLSGTERPYTTEHNGPILFDVRGLISLRFQNRTSQYFGHSEWNTMSQYFFLSWVLFLSLTFGHITLRSVWSSLDLVWHMSCRKLIVPVKFTVWTFINLNLVVIYVHTYPMCTWVVIEQIQYLDGISTTYIDYIVCAFELWMTCIQMESDCSSCRRSGSAN